MSADGGYRRLSRRLFLPRSRRALEHLVGGNFVPFGSVMRDLIVYAGVKPDARVIDVGCGAGRLTAALTPWLEGTYLGLDIDETLLRAARTHGRPQWRFARVRKPEIPAGTAAADLVTFFSVFTHLSHEHSYVYLREASRVLAPGGRIIVSFLEFGQEIHWSVFARTVHDWERRNVQTNNVFIEHGALAVWCERLGLRLIEYHPGSELFIPLREPVTLEDGNVMTDRGALGQSIAIIGA